MIKISVVIPTCDRPTQLVAALRSVKAQSVGPAEIVVVDNSTISVESERLPVPVTLIRLPPRVGVSRARNVGVRAARGDYAAFLDDDDTWAPDYLMHMRDAIVRHTQPDCLVGRMDVMVDGQQRAYKCVSSLQDLMPALLYRNPSVGGQCIVVCRQTFIDLGGFDESLITSEDRALVLDFLRASARVVCVPQAVAIKGIPDGNRLTDTATMLKGKRQFIAKYRQLMGMDEWLAAHAQVMTIRARDNRIYWLLAVAVRIARRALASLAAQLRQHSAGTKT